MADFREYVGIDLSGGFIVHYGVGHLQGGHSGRYPWGSSNNVKSSGSKVGQINDVISSDKYFKKRTTSINADKFGSDANHNILYVTGLSGSGKSSLAVQMKHKGNNVIHLDLYFEKTTEEDRKQQDADLNKFLKSHGVEYEKMSDKSISQEERFKVIDEFTDALDGFAKEQYKKGKGVVCEGVEIADEVAWPDKQYFKGKPMVLMTTSKIRSMLNGMERDNISPFDLYHIANQLKYQKVWSKQLKELQNIARG